MPGLGFWVDGQGVVHSAQSGAILFYDNNSDYYAFTNFYNAASFNLVLNQANYTFRTSEHAFQALKFAPGSEEFMAVLNAKTSRDVFNLANGTDGRFKDKIRPDWQNVSEAIMYQILCSKFSQDPNLKQLLAQTGDRVLIENAGGNDSFWGNGVDGRGQNKLGICLMQTRTELGRNPGMVYNAISTDLVLPSVRQETDLQKAVRLIRNHGRYGTASSRKGIVVEFGISQQSGGVYIQEKNSDKAIYVAVDGVIKEGQKGHPNTYRVVTEEQSGWTKWAAPIVSNALDKSKDNGYKR